MSKQVVCQVCGERRPHKARGMCQACYTTKRNHETGRNKPMSENTLCSQYLGVHIAERVLAKVFKDVEVMPHNNPGYDFVCGKGYKIDVKSACLNAAGMWVFNIKRNTTADYFLCLVFDNRTNLTPIHIWLLPGDLVNHLITASVSTNTFDKWAAYKLDVDKVIIQCDTLR